MADTPTIWQQNTPWAVHSICTDHHVTLTLMQDPCLLAWWTRTFSVAGSSRASYRVDYRGITTNVNPRLDSPDVTMSAHKPIRLPPLKTLRVRAPNAKPERPCMAIMSSVLCKLAPRHHQPIQSLPPIERIVGAVTITLQSFCLTTEHSY